MKKLMIPLIMLFFGINYSYGQIAFGVAPGLSLNSAYLGYKIDNTIVPYFGFQYLSAGFEISEIGKKYDYDLKKLVSYMDKAEANASLFIPNIGIKYFVAKQNKIQAYVNLNLSKPILSAELKDNTTDSPDLRDFNEGIDNLSIFGGELGFGVEYFFDDNFSVGGEFGIRYFHLEYDDIRNRDIYNPDIGNDQSVEIEDNFQFNISPTFSRISLNYYF